MTAAELAKESGLHVGTILRMARNNQLPGEKRGNRGGWKFDRVRALRALTLKFGNAAEKELTRRPR